MTGFSVMVRNKVDIEKKPRVYFNCHPDDFEKYFHRICGDLFRTQDCAIYHITDRGRSLEEVQRENEAGRFDLMVLPVTGRLLTAPSRVLEEDLVYVRRNHIPVLPILMEPGLDELYARQDRFGEMQYLDSVSSDPTMIPYEQKLEKYLGAVLISTRLAERVRGAFDASIFLSYRKRDRVYANELMRRIHDIPGCEAVAIWFDEFLTPGESFRENIGKQLDACELFVLTVTPRILDPVIDENGVKRDNFVLGTELPLAKRKQEETGMDILAMEMEPTDAAALRAVGIDGCLGVEDRTFPLQVLDALGLDAASKQEDPEKSHLMGMAYLYGIDVERDPQRAIGLLEKAARASHTEAAARLVEVYRYGICVSVSREKAVFWQEHRVRLLTELWHQRQTAEDLDELIWAYLEQGDLCRRAGQKRDAEEAYAAAAELVTEGSMLSGEPVIRRGIEAAYTRLAELYQQDLFDMDRAAVFSEKAMELQKAIHQTENTTRSARYLALCHQRTAGLMSGKKRFEEAKAHLLTAIGLLEGLEQTEERLKAARDMACCYERLGWIHRECGEIREAFDCCGRCIELRRTLNEICETDESLRDLCITHIQMGHLYREGMDPQNALEHYAQAVDAAGKRTEADDTLDAIATYANACDCMGKVYLDLGRYKDAAAWSKRALDYCLSVPERKTMVELLRYMSNAYETLAWVEDAEGDPEGLAEKYNEQILAMRTVVAEITGTLESKIPLSIAYENLGARCKRGGRYDEAIGHYEMARQLREEVLRAGETSQALRYLAITHDHLGDACFDSGRIREALEHFRTASDLRLEAMKTGQTLDGLYELSVSYKKLGDVFMVLGAYDGAAVYYGSMLQLSEGMAERSEDQRIQRNLMIALSDYGIVSLKRGELSDAGYYLGRAIQLNGKLDKQYDTAETKEDFFKTLERAAEVSIARNAPEETLPLYSLMLHYAVKLLEREDTPRNRERFAVTLLDAAVHCPQRYGRADIDAAVGILEQLCADFPEERYLQKKLEYARTIRQGRE